MVQSELEDKLEYYKSRMPIFETFRIEEQIKTLMGRKVPIPNGGHIVIDHTEAMTVIDVNSGRYAAKKEQELNSLKTDLEASREIVRQLRLRDIGGLIVVDFIDLEEEKNRKKIYDELRKEFKKDRAKIAILPMTDFGIVQITRQRVRQNIVQSINEVCPYCSGTGLMTKRSSVIHDIDEWLKRYKSEGKFRNLILSVHPSLSNDLRIGMFSTLSRLQFKYFLKIKLEDNEQLNPQEFEIKNAKTNYSLFHYRKDIMKFFIDTANVNEIKEAAAMGLLDGVTTNPSLVAKEGKDFNSLLKEIVEIVDGPISAEVVSTDYEGMIKEAKELASIHKNIVVKIPLIQEGIKAVKTLSSEGINTNVTLCFSASQAILAAKAGATYISPFVGRLDDISHSGMQLIDQIVRIYENYGFSTQVLVASIRHPLHLVEAAELGAHVATIPFAVIKKLFNHPLTENGLEKFLSDWKTLNDGKNE